MVQNSEHDDQAVARRKLDNLSHLMDSAIRLPGGYRIGWDGVIGLIPGVGDLAGMGISLYILYQASRLGASRTTLLRMLSNVGIETVIGAIPLIGDVFDLTFKANNRNMKILDGQFKNPSDTNKRSVFWLFLLIMVAIAIVILGLWLTFTIVISIVGWIV